MISTERHRRPASGKLQSINNQEQGPKGRSRFGFEGKESKLEDLSLNQRFLNFILNVQLKLNGYIPVKNQCNGKAKLPRQLTSTNAETPFEHSHIFRSLIFFCCKYRRQKCIQSSTQSRINLISILDFMSQTTRKPAIVIKISLDR